MDSDFPLKKLNKKKLENIERLKKKQEVTESRKKLKQKKQLAERKKNKNQRSSLIEKLALHHRQNEEVIKNVGLIKSQTRNLGKISKKLRCVSGKVEKSVKVQKYYVETDSSSSEEECDLEVSNEDFPSSCVSTFGDIVQSNTLLIQQQPVSKSKSENFTMSKKRSADDTPTVMCNLSSIKGDRICVQRLESIDAQRMLLPICGEEQEIMEAINENIVVIICGEPGSGKTTQVPQFLYEAGYTSKGHLIGITEPRRIAAITMSHRIGEELNDRDVSSYQIRHEGNVTDKTRLLFMTDGVLIRELQNDSSLSKFSAIIIDEAHERSIYTDVLIGCLSRICIARNARKLPLKLIIMSATLRLQDFLQKRLFPKSKPKVINVKSRQFPVTVKFQRVTPSNYLEAVFNCVCKIHRNHPPGGILVFLSGQKEVQTIIKWLREAFSAPKSRVEYFPKKGNHMEIGSVDSSSDNTKFELQNFELFDAEEFNDIDMSDDDEIPEAPQCTEENSSIRSCGNLFCLPLFSLLPTYLQQRVFTPELRDSERLCVVATNVAETSLTIPNIRYVVDAGKEKHREYDPITGVSRFVVRWISRASSDQRSGRAGRTQPGHTFRLYSSAVYQDFPEFSPPEILNKPIDQLVVLLKSMGFKNLMNFPFPTPPNCDQIIASEKSLLAIGALEHYSEGTHTRLSALGQNIALIPLAPHFAKIILLSNQHGLLPYVVTLVSALSVREPLIALSSINEETNLDTQRKMTNILTARKTLCDVGEAKQLGDLCMLMSIICAADYDGSAAILSDFGIRPKALQEIRNLRKQLVAILKQSGGVEFDEMFKSDFKLNPPSQRQYRFIRHLFSQCMQENIAKRVDNVINSTHQRGAYKCKKLSEFVFIDPTSMLYKEQPDYVLYQEINELFGRKTLQCVSFVETEWITDLVKNFFNC